MQAKRLLHPQCYSTQTIILLSSLLALSSRHRSSDRATQTMSSSSKPNFFGRAWNRARGKSDVERICRKVFDDLADEETELLHINSLHVATLMVYNSINKQLGNPHKDPPCLKIIGDKVKEYKAKEKEGIAFTEFQEMILDWVEKDLRLVLVNKAGLAILGAPLLAVTAKSAARKVPRVGDAVDKVPTPLIAAAFSVGLLFLQDVWVWRQTD